MTTFTLTKRLEIMKTVADFADEFARRAANGGNPSVFVSKHHVETFLMALAREGFAFAKEAFDNIKDPDLRKIIETIFFATVAGAAGGAAIGMVVGGPPGAQVGAMVGAGLGFAAGCIALTITAREEDDGLQFSIA
jgi:hypothetical protein